MFVARIEGGKLYIVNSAKTDNEASKHYLEVYINGNCWFINHMNPVKKG